MDRTCSRLGAVELVAGDLPLGGAPPDIIENGAPGLDLRCGLAGEIERGMRNLPRASARVCRKRSGIRGGGGGSTAAGLTGVAQTRDTVLDSG